MPSHNGKYYSKKPPESNNSDCKSIKSFFSINSNTASSSSSSPLDENSNNDRADTNLQNENDGATAKKLLNLLTDEVMRGCFPMITTLVNLINIVPTSTASVERIFLNEFIVHSIEEQAKPSPA